MNFCYPHANSNTLCGINLDVPAGRTVAIIGANGSGKSTLAKIICGIYPPTTGTCQIDGEEAHSVAKCAIVSQRPAHFLLSVSDNVSFGGPVDDIVAEEAGLSVDLLARNRPDGGHPQLSGGEWQRVALARCLAALARGRTVAILDEPTSALDPIFERQFFDSFRTATSAATTILITHRISSIAESDHVVVMQAGRIVETGLMTDLQARKGPLHKMWLEARQGIS